MTNVTTKNKPFVLSLVDHEILLAVSQFHYLSVEHLLRLRYRKSSLTYGRYRLKRLADHQFLQRTWALRATPFGKPPTLYRLGPTGIRYLREAGYSVTVRYRPSDHTVHADGFLSHVLAVNDVLIAARQLEQLLPSLTICGMKHDLDLKRTPITIMPLQSTPLERVTIVPDGFLDLSVTGVRQRRQPIVLEVDRGTEAVKDFKRKIRAYLAFLNGPYQETFGTKYGKITIVVDTAAFLSPTAADRRVRDLRRWIEEELKVHGKEQLASWFHLRSLPRGFALDPKVFFLAPSWSVPFCPSPVSLLAVPGSGVERGSTESEQDRHDTAAVSPARAIR